MSAPNPSSTDRDLESLRRAQRAHEPSMEEILASIRSIIADDREPAAAPAPKVGASAGPQIVYTNNAAPSARPVAAAPETAEAAPPPSPAPAPAPAAVAAPSPKVVWEKPASPPPAAAVAPPAAPAPQPNEAAPADEEPFASVETEAAVAASFQALSTTVALQSTAMIESLTRDMLRPMLKSWLDDNLPSIVERLVRAEIQRVARGGR
jgi:cell pole-organizing protein PopZ